MTTTKIPIAKVWIRACEGTIATCELLKSHTWTSLGDASRALQMHAWPERPKDAGYLKVNFALEWADGQSYEGRFDLGGDDWPDLARHVRDFASVYALRVKPAHMDADDWARFCALHGDRAADWAELLDTREIL